MTNTKQLREAARRRADAATASDLLSQAIAQQARGLRVAKKVFHNSDAKLTAAEVTDLETYLQNN